MAAGELLSEAKAKLGHGDWLPWLEANCEVSVRTAQAYMRVGREWPQLADTQRVALLPMRAALEMLAEPRPMFIHVSDDSYEWFTPQDHIEAVRKVMGSIDLDPASTAKANEVVKAQRFYAAEDDGLTQPWAGNVFLNPPYNMPLVEQFVQKAVFDYREGRMSQAVILTNNSTDTAWFQTLLDFCPTCFTKGRLHFWARKGKCWQPGKGRHSSTWGII